MGPGQLRQRAEPTGPSEVALEQATGPVRIAVAGAAATPHEVVFEQDAAFGGAAESVRASVVAAEVAGFGESVLGHFDDDLLPLSSSGQVIHLRPSRLVTRPRGLRCSTGAAVDPTHRSQNWSYWVMVCSDLVCRSCARCFGAREGGGPPAGCPAAPLRA